MWDALNPPTTDLDRYISRLSNTLTDMVSCERDPALHKQVVIIDGFPCDVDEAAACRSRIYSGSSPDQQFPDMVVSLVCDKQTAENRFFARVPGLPVELYQFWERRFEDGWRSYEESTIPLINSYRERGIPVVEVCALIRCSALAYPSSPVASVKVANRISPWDVSRLIPMAALTTSRTSITL